MNSIKLYGSVILAMIIWSFSFIWTRVAILSFPPVTLVTLRLIIASVLLFVVAKSFKKLQRVKLHDLKWFLLLAFFEPFMYFMGETYGLTMVDATSASVIIATIPLFAPVLAFFILRERLGWMNIAGIIVSLAGIFFVVYKPGFGFSAHPLGVSLLFLAVFSAICYSAVLRKIAVQYTSITIVFYQSVLGLVFFVPTFFVVDYRSVGEMIISGESLVALLMLSIFASVIAFIFFANVVRKIGVARTNVFVNLIPVFTAVFSWLILKEMLSLLQWLGIGIVILGLFVSQINKRSMPVIVPEELMKPTEY